MWGGVVNNDTFPQRHTCDARDNNRLVSSYTHTHEATIKRIHMAYLLQHFIIRKKKIFTCDVT